MIDDNFDEIVRNIFEQFFGGAFRQNPHIHISGTMQNDNVTRGAERAESRNVFVDVIEYEDDIIVVVDTREHIENPEARIMEGILELWLNPSVTRPIRIELPTTVDIDKSELSVTNAIIEIRLAKSKGKQKEGILGVTY